jgi:hypothetical protein
MSTHRRPQRIVHRPARRGAVLIEFAFVALAFYLLFAGTITMGTMISTAQAVQNAARVGARELALVALPPTMTFRQALHDPAVKARVYDPELLAVPVTGGVLPDTSSWPVINRMLTPLMIYDTIGTADFYHYPGAVISTGSGYSVKVPVVSGRDSDGVETISLHDVVEEVVDSDGNGPFSLAASVGVYHERGLVALRINCPYQSASMTAFKFDPQAGHEGVQDAAILANDSNVHTQSYPGEQVSTGLNFVGNATPNPDNPNDYGAYAGKYGLGRMLGPGPGDLPVRPFRRMISAQSLFRREVFR